MYLSIAEMEPRTTTEGFVDGIECHPTSGDIRIEIHRRPVKRMFYYIGVIPKERKHFWITINLIPVDC